jgi:hypothetical protein
MTKHSRSRSHRRRCSNRRSNRVKRGGSYSSASTYGSYVNGGLNNQFSRTFDQSGSNAANQSNILVGAQGQNSHLVGGPSSQQLSLVQSAGKGKKSGTRGGYFGEVINQAIVPLSLLGFQQTFGRKKRGGKKTRRV